MSKDILSLISSKMNTFSKGQKLIANYILSSYDKAAFMTASKLGKTVHVSESTVVRFASELKYDGYPAMQKALQEMIRNKLTSIQRIEVTNDIIGNQDVVSTVMQSDMEKIRLTMESDMASFVDSLVAPLSLINSLLVAIARSKSDVVDHFERLEHIWEEYGVFVSMEEENQ